MTDRSDPQTDALRQRQRRKNLAVLGVLVGLIAVIYLMTIVKLQGS